MSHRVPPEGRQGLTPTHYEDASEATFDDWVECWRWPWSGATDQKKAQRVADEIKKRSPHLRVRIVEIRVQEEL